MRYKVHVTFAARREDLVCRAVESVRDIGNIHVWSDGRPSPSIPGVTHHSPGLVGIVPMMNMCIKTSWDDDVMFWMHDDAEARPGIAKEFLEIVRSRTGQRWGLILTNQDKLCAFNMKAVREVGYWDTMFFQYGADSDYHCRLRLARWGISDSGLQEGVSHNATQTGSETREHGGDPLYMHKIQFIDGCEFHNHYYEFKWGGPRGNEVFTRPFAEDKMMPKTQAVFARHRAMKGQRA